MKWEKINEAVYSTPFDIVKVDQYDLKMLKDNIQSTPDKRIRLCMHHKDALLHEMIIAISEDSYIRPHKHTNKSESFHMIEGEMDIVIFNDEGHVTEMIPMGPPFSGKNFFYRLSKPSFHTIVFRSELVVFHETTNGPFCKEETIMAPWSPTADKTQEVELFLLKLKRHVCQTSTV